MTLPYDPISLADLQALTDLLLRACVGSRLNDTLELTYLARGRQPGTQPTSPRMGEGNPRRLDLTLRATLSSSPPPPSRLLKNGRRRPVVCGLMESGSENGRSGKNMSLDRAHPESKFYQPPR
jgi:hypothetical protein